MTSGSKKPEAIVRMVARWMDDERLLAALFGPYSEDDFSDGAEMQRNLSTAIAYGNGLLNKIQNGEASS